MEIYFSSLPILPSFRQATARKSNSPQITMHSKHLFADAMHIDGFEGGIYLKNCQ